MKIKEAQLHDLIRQVSKGLMSFSQMVEILNETAEKPSEPVFCPDCGGRIRLTGNGVAEQLCTCHRWPTVILQSEKWPPEPNGTTTAGIDAKPSEKSGQMKTPHKCPVCEGRGNVLYGFYLDRETQSTDARLNEPCRQCGGAGIIYT
jgi:RecJ-like exonuclease